MSELGEAWLTSPLDIVQDLLTKHGDDYGAHVKTFFSEKLAQGFGTVAQVPSLNDCKLHNLKPNSLVRFRCMVQDMFGPEFYLDSFDLTTCGASSKMRRCSGRFRDVIVPASHERGDEQPLSVFHASSSANADPDDTAVTSERQVYYCIPVPCENEWAKKVHCSKAGCMTPSTSSIAPRNKRNADEGGSSDLEDMDTTDTDSVKRKRVIDTSEESCQAAKSFSGTSALPGEEGLACLVKIYDDTASIKLNDVLEVIGVLSIDPALTAIISEEAANTPFVEEFHAHNPPASLVPRLHAVAFHKPTTLYPQMTSDVFVHGILPELQECREELLAILERALLGDRLAAEYALCSLAASVYGRCDHIALGKFCLNISGFAEKDNALVSLFYNVLQHLRPASFRLELTVNSANSLVFVPKKDYVTDRLTSGILQLAAGTLLVVDETHLEPGQLNQNGTKNLAALSSLINWQRVAYDFSYHMQEFDCDISVMTLSDGKSILPHDCQVPLSRQGCASVVQASCDAIWTYLTPKLVERLRCYLDAIVRAPYDVPDSMQKHVQEDFVSARQQDPKNMTVEDFQLRIILARLVSLSSGSSVLTEETWSRVRAMEEERKSRLSAYAHRNNGHVSE